MKNGFAKRYDKLEKEYNILKERYKGIGSSPIKVLEIAEYRIKRHFLNLVMFIFVSYGIYYYKHPLIIIVGLLTAIVDFVWETHCVKNNLWEYESSYYFPGSRLPIMLPITYFLIGAFAVIYVLFRLGY